MHEYSKRIGEHIKFCYSDFNKMNREELDELKAWACVMKDLTEADINIRGIKAMDEAEQEEKFYGRMGYDRYRYKNGRFAPKGRGRRMGYIPYVHAPMPLSEDEEYYDFYDEIPYPMTGYRMGYTSGKDMPDMDVHSSDKMRWKDGMHDDDASMRRTSKYGESYDRYKDNRRHYTENPTPEHQKMMKDSADEVFDDIESLAKKMYEDADAQDRAKLKTKMTQLVQSMK